ncbi:MAG: hypothetical protein KKF48_01220 [Nanoarchaeota archaeon]|nr:hypothetical protein [Nanoarchaeota archaeon]MBU1027643.1 hypothetical protein [Nanoarchaeota archaeon]
MKIGIIGPSNIEFLIEINPYADDIINKLSKVIVDFGYEIVVTPDKGSVSELFVQNYLDKGGKKVFEIVPLDDKEFGYDWLNVSLGENINCGTWRNQPEKLNEECDVLLCVGYSVGVFAEIAYAKWFKPKKVYIIKDLVSGELPREINKRLDIESISFGEFSSKIQNV